METTKTLKPAGEVLDWYIVQGADRNGRHVWTVCHPTIGYNIYVLQEKKPNLGLKDRQCEFLAKSVQGAYDAAS